MWRVLLALAVAAVLGAAALTWLSRGPSSTAEELADRLAASGDVARFDFDHGAGGTAVLDCVLPNRRISGTVDYVAGVAILRNGSASEIARRGVRRVWLHRDLFAKGVVPTTWLGLALPATTERRDQLTEALGTELAGYVLAEGLPATGRATALAALDAAERVDALRSDGHDGGRRDGYRIIVDEDRFADPASGGERQAPGTDVGPPTVEVWLDENDRVRRVVVVPGRRPGAQEPTSGGWVIDYRTAASPVDDRPPASVTDVAEIELSRLQARPSAGGCEVPL